MTTVPGVDGEASSEVSGLAVAEHQPIEGPYDGDFFVQATIENVGERITKIFEYNHYLQVFDADGNNITGDGIGTEGDGDRETAPGETHTLTLSAKVTSTPDDVARYELTVRCEGIAGRTEAGSYCE